MEESLGGCGLIETTLEVEKDGQRWVTEARQLPRWPTTTTKGYLQLLGGRHACTQDGCTPKYQGQWLSFLGRSEL